MAVEFDGNDKLSFDFKVLKEMIPDKVMYEEIKHQFVVVSRRDLLLIKDFIESKNRSELYMLAHKLSGRFAQMGSVYFGNELSALERELKDTISDEILNRFENLAVEMDLAIERIN